MKVQTKTPSAEIKKRLSETYDYDLQSDYENIIDTLNSTEHGYTIQRLLPSDYKTRIKFSEKYNANDEFYNDLYDANIELETRKTNSRPTPTRIQDMTPKEKAAYLQAKLDQESESFT